MDFKRLLHSMALLRVCDLWLGVRRDQHGSKRSLIGSTRPDLLLISVVAIEEVTRRFQAKVREEGIIIPARPVIAAGSRGGIVLRRHGMLVVNAPIETGRPEKPRHRERCVVAEHEAGVYGFY